MLNKEDHLNNTVCFVAGHSGGHIIPCLTTAEKIIQENKNTKIIFFSTNSSLDLKIINQHAHLISQLIPLSLKKIPYSQLWLLPICLLSFINAFFKSYKILKKNKVKKIISMGGLVSIPVCLAGKLLKIPIVLHELNVKPGKAVKLLAPIASSIKINFAETQKYLPSRRCDITNYPVRFDDSALQINKEQARLSIGLSYYKHTILIVGGSQGSIFINKLIKNWIIKHPELHDKIQIIHQTGSRDTYDWQAWYIKHQIQAITFAYHDRMEDYYAAADIVICRSGAGTLAEVAFFKKKCITIPLETKTTNHQVSNALAMSKKHPDLFVVLKQQNAEQMPFILNDIVEKTIQNT